MAPFRQSPGFTVPMCHYIVLVAENKNSDPAITDILGALRRTRFETDMGNRVRGLPPGSHAVYSSPKPGCDCGTAIGSIGVFDGRGMRVSEQDIRDLRRKGWSEGKISRRVAEAEKIYRREKRVFDQGLAEVESCETDPDGWAAAIISAFEKHRLGGLGILKHWVSDRVDGSKIVNISLSDDLGRRLLRLEENRLYWINRCG